MISPNPNWNSYGISRNSFCCILTTLLLSLSFISYAQLAFPTAEGFGKNATGGRGGAVIKVTNLNDSGPGSLRQALMYTSGPRTVVFEVGGTITLNSALGVNYGDVTIAGQTAPGDGILIKGSMVIINESNVIMRYIRFRPGQDAPANEPDGLNITTWTSGTVRDIIIDHCSMSWSVDENFDARVSGPGTGKVENVTLQYCIVSESTYGSIGGAGTFKKTYYKNFYAHNQERNLMSGAVSSTELDLEMINNLIYGTYGVTGLNLGSKHTVLNNHFRESSQQSMYGTIVDYRTDPEGVNGQGVYAETHAYVSGNLIPSGKAEYSSNVVPYIKTTPYLSSGIIPIPAAQVADDILPHVGASLPTRDAVDIRLVNQYNNGNGAIANSGTYPTIQGGTAPNDADNDGMPDVWENQNGLNPNNPSDRNIVQPDGYTNLEYYLNGMNLESLGAQVVISTNDGDNIICQGEDIILTASEADSYLWNTNGETSSSITVSPDITTTYTVTGTHSNGDITQAEITITVNETPTANAGPDVETCQGTAVTLTASGGTSYEWSNGETTASITVNPNATQTFTVTVGNNDNCSSTYDVVVTVNQTPNVDAGEDQSIFLGDSATLMATGADSYLWSTGETTQTITVNPLLDTSFSVIGTTNNCEQTDTVTVFLQDDSVSANAGEDIEICHGETTTLTATGGTTYLWNTGETTASIDVTPTEITTYTVTAFSPSGNNQAEDSVTVTVNEIPIANAGEDTEICFGNSTTLIASGGTSFLWSTGETTESIIVSPTETTTYSVEIFENNCSSIDDVSVIVNPLPNVDAGNDISSIEGELMTLTASGANTYLWNTGETTVSITVNPVLTTTYSVIGFLNGCEATDEVTVTILSETVAANAGEDLDICQGETVTLTATGGTTYLWNTGETTASIEVTPNVTTTYAVTVFSPSGNNQDEDSVIVTVNDIPLADAGNNTEICLGNSTTLTATGGSAYLWSTGETTQSITVNPNQTTSYSVEVFENNCSSSDEVQVTVNALPEINAGFDVTITEGESTTVIASGADTYIWSTGETTASITVNPNITTTYSVTGFSNGCEAIDEVIVTVISEDNVNANAGTDVSICQGETTTLTATGGDTYLWNTGETTASIEVLPTQTTTYTVTAFSPSGNNQDDDSVMVTVNDVPVADAGNDIEICFGNSTTLTASGGSAYLWSTGETTQSITVNPNQTTTYSVEVFENNCSSLDEVLVTINALPTIDAGSNVTIMEGETITLTATGADTYEWSTGETTGSITVNPNNTTTYSVTGFSNQCEASDDVLVTVIPFEFVASAGANREICQGYQTTLTASEGDAYLWSTGETTQSITVNPSTTQTYSVTVYQGEFQDDADVTVQVNENPNVVIMNGGDVTILEGEFITLSATGAETYLWNNGATQPNIAVSPTATTTYEVTGYINNCEDIKEVQVNVVEFVQADAGEDVFICNNETVTLTASGGDEYLWNTGATTQSIEVSPNEDTEYSVLVYNALDGDEDSVRVFVEQCDIVELPSESEDFGFVVYQDPMSDILKIKINGLSSVNVTGLSVYDITGKAIYNEQLNPADLENQSELVKEINTSLYARGIYMVKLIYDDTNAMKKVPIK